MTAFFFWKWFTLNGHADPGTHTPGYKTPYTRRTPRQPPATPRARHTCTAVPHVQGSNKNCHDPAHMTASQGRSPIDLRVTTRDRKNTGGQCRTHCSHMVHDMVPGVM